MAQGLQQVVVERQLALYELPELAYPGGAGPAVARPSGARPEGAPSARRSERPQVVRRRRVPRALLCAACRTRQARYGFRDETLEDPLDGRPRALCFECFRREIDRRHAAELQVRRRLPAPQPSLPLEERLHHLARRRRRAQIAARHALGI